MNAEEIRMEIYSYPFKRHAFANLNMTKRNVNEQNEKALEFYEHFGIKVISRFEHDESGF